jgi:hypothetical protein
MNEKDGSHSGVYHKMIQLVFIFAEKTQISWISTLKESKSSTPLCLY